MQIQGNFNSYSNNSYDHNHTHHITKCLHEEEQKKPDGGQTGMKNDTFSSKNMQEDIKPEVTFTHENVQGRTSGYKKSIGFFKGIWDSMGEEGTNERQSILSSDKNHMGLKGMEIISTAMKHLIPYRAINKLESVREKIKVNISNTLKHFGKHKDTFSALTDPKGHFAGKRENNKQLEESREKGTRKAAGSIPTAAQTDSHLMDSYSKTGAYCRLNENLTYQKKSTLVKKEEHLVKGE